MSSTGPVPSLRALVDAVGYAIAVTLGVLVLAAVLTALTGGAGGRFNVFVFVAGWVIMAYATFRLWPSWPDDDDPIELERGDPIPQVHDTRLQGVVRSVPPVRWIDLPPPEDRISVYGQLFGSSVIVLLTSLCLEVVFGLGT